LARDAVSVHETLLAETVMQRSIVTISMTAPHLLANANFADRRKMLRDFRLTCLTVRDLLGISRRHKVVDGRRVTHRVDAVHTKSSDGLHARVRRVRSLFRGAHDTSAGADRLWRISGLTSHNRRGDLQVNGVVRSHRRKLTMPKG
jgi:hypothetical protein